MSFLDGLGRRSGALALALALDALLGEPPAAVHPVGRFGQAMARIEGWTWADDRRRGLAHASLGVGAAWALAAALEGAAGAVPALVGVTAVAVAGRSLLETASAVGRLLEAGDLEQARQEVRALVGRDPTGLDQQELARAVIESVAENLTDAVVGSALWGLLAGARGVAAHRAANTLDAMVGHHNERYERFGWAAARLDDLLNWPAARLTALLVAAAAPRRSRAIRETVRRDAGGHPSPNAGVAEAALAAALGVRLGGTNRYGDRVEVRNPLGRGRPPEPSDIAAAVALGRRVVVLLAAGLALLSVLARAR